MRFKRHIALEKGTLDIAPLIDVVFQLLIFFMLTSSFVSYQGIKVNLPAASSAKSLAQEDIVILVSDDNRLFINNKEVSFKELNATLKNAARSKGHILIKADKKSSWGKVVEIWDLCRNAGITNVNIATSQKKSDKGV